MPIRIIPMTVDDFDEAYALWEKSEGVSVGDFDTREHIGKYLARNPGLSLVARDGDALAGAVLCGHDGRRGLLFHLAVAETHRRRGVGRALVEGCMKGLQSAGVRRCYLFVLDENETARAFYRRLGWKSPEGWGMMYCDNGI